MRTNTQAARVLAALRSRGQHGICAVDFLVPDVCDGGSPILRLPSRINDLKNVGHDIENTGKRRSKTDIYVLRAECLSPHRRGRSSQAGEQSRSSIVPRSAPFLEALLEQTNAELVSVTVLVADALAGGVEPELIEAWLRAGRPPTIAGLIRARELFDHGSPPGRADLRLSKPPATLYAVQ